jgi:hypothetical protein
MNLFFAEFSSAACTISLCEVMLQPKQVTINSFHQVKMIQELEPEEKSMVFKMVDTFLTKKKFKDFFQKNVAML